MSRRKDDVVDVEVPSVMKSLSVEAMRLLDIHRSFFHTIDKKDCKICRSFRRTILGGLSK